jgi:hypothetical protein
MDGKRFLSIGVSLGIILIGVLSVSLGYEQTWRLWNIPTLSPCFADCRVITSGAESRALGYNPLLNNPQDPWKRTMNYPRIWQMLYRVGVNQNDTVYGGCLFAALFVLGLFLYTPATLTRLTSAILILSIFSPAVLTGVERGNNDLLMFFLLSLAIFCMKSDGATLKGMAVAAVLTAFVLKLYPIFGVGLILNQKKKFVMRMGLFAVAFATIYCLATYIDLVWIRHAVPDCVYPCYGINILWMKVGNHGPAGLGRIMKLLSYIVVVICLALALRGIFSKKFSCSGEADRDQRTLDAFRVGSGVYVGTFLLGSNFDYRLVFLLFVIPQLALWANSRFNSIAKVAQWAVLAIVFSLWRFILDPFVSFLHLGFWGSLLPEISSWFIFGGLLFLFSCSLPQWVKDAAVNLCFPKARRP